MLLTGDFRGDGQPKPIAFPDPAQLAHQAVDGLPVVDLRTLLELKLASGMSASHRLPDLADVIPWCAASGSRATSTCIRTCSRSTASSGRPLPRRSSYEGRGG